MRTMVILILFIAAGAFGWHWYKARPQAAVPAPSSPAIGFASDPGTGPAAGLAAPPLTPVAPGVLPAALKSSYDQAEGLWKRAAASGEAPAVTGQAPAMDKLYSSVLQGIYGHPEFKALETRLITDRLTPLGDELFFSRTRYPSDQTGIFIMHEVAPGESPDRIAKKYGMSSELLNRLRGMTNLTDSNLRAGDRLKVATVREHGGYFLHICKSDYFLDCYIAGLFARRYPISIGAKETPTPVGRTHLIDRVSDPPWTDPHTHEVYLPNDPRNILGGVWLAFSPDGIGQTGLGIHGYTGPNARMQAMVSNGCVRLDTPQARELMQTLAHPDRCPTAVEIVE